MEDPINKSALLLMSLGEDLAAEVFKHLGPKEVQKIGLAMASLKTASKQEVSQVVSEFLASTDNRANFGAADEYIKSVLKKALGEDKANSVLDRILQGGDSNGIEGLKWMSSDAVAELIKNEHPQIIATILAHLEPDQVAEIITYFPERLRNDTILRVATIDGIQPTAIKELNDVLTRLLSGSDKIKKTKMGGVARAAEILNFMGNIPEASALASIREVNPEIAQQIQDKMFVFENLLDVDDRGIQLILREIQAESLLLALKGTSNDIKEKIFNNMSQRAAEMLREDLDNKGPVKLSEVENAQKEILKLAKQLADEGKIVLGGKGEEMV